MKAKTLLALSIVVVVAGVWSVACNNTAGDKTKTVTMDSTAFVKRGEYLVLAGGCDDCHSPKRMGARGPEIIPELRLSGFQATDKLPPVDTTEIMKGWALFGPGQTSTIGPWGASFAANITSDASGIGSWSEAQFINCIRKGKYKGLDESRPLLPPMPWTALRNLTDDDLKSMYYYLKTTTPVRNVVPGPKALSELK